MISKVLKISLFTLFQNPFKVINKYSTKILGASLLPIVNPNQTINESPKTYSLLYEESLQKKNDPISQASGVSINRLSDQRRKSITTKTKTDLEKAAEARQKSRKSLVITINAEPVEKAEDKEAEIERKRRIELYRSFMEDYLKKTEAFGQETGALFVKSSSISSQGSHIVVKKLRYVKEKSDLENIFSVRLILPKSYIFTSPLLCSIILTL